MKYEEMLRMQKKKGIRKKSDNEEHRIQTAMVGWFRMQYPKMQHNLFAVPNGGRRDAITGTILKAEGVLAGVADLILLKSNRNYGALLIETKTRKGKQRDTQKEWESKITKDGYKYVIVRSLDDFMREVKSYLMDV